MGRRDGRPFSLTKAQKAPPRLLLAGFFVGKLNGAVFVLCLR